MKPIAVINVLSKCYLIGMLINICMRRCILVAILFVVLNSFNCTSIDSSKSRESTISFSLNVQNKPLEKCIKDIKNQMPPDSKYNIVLTPNNRRLAEEPVTLHANEIGLEKLIRHLCEANSLDCDFPFDNVCVVTKKPRINKAYVDCPVSTIIYDISVISATFYNIVAINSLIYNKKLTINLSNIPCDEALLSICQYLNLHLLINIASGVMLLADDIYLDNVKKEWEHYSAYCNNYQIALEMPITIVGNDIRLIDAINLLAATSNINITINQYDFQYPQVGDIRIRELDLNEVPWIFALKIILNEAGCSSRYINERSIVIEKPESVMTHYNNLKIMDVIEDIRKKSHLIIEIDNSVDKSAVVSVNWLWKLSWEDILVSIAASANLMIVKMINNRYYIKNIK